MKRHVEAFDWFGPEQCIEIAGRFKALGGPAFCRLEIRHVHGKPLLRVVRQHAGDVAADDDPPPAPPDINDSHRCPPDCP